MRTTSLLACSLMGGISDMKHKAAIAALAIQFNVDVNAVVINACTSIHAGRDSVLYEFDYEITKVDNVSGEYHRITGTLKMENTNVETESL